jgi:hypothetical protein
MFSLAPFTRYVFVLLTLCIMRSPLAHAALIELQPNPLLAATTGDSIAINLVVSGLGTDLLGAFDVSVGFDSSALSFTSYSLGNYLGNINLLEAIDGGVGDTGSTVNVSEVSLLSAFDLDTLQPGSFTLATLNFNVINLPAGTMTQLSVLSGLVLGDALGSPIAVTGLGSTNVGTVPVPGTLFLLAASMLGWLALKRRQFVQYQVKQAEIK